MPKSSPISVSRLVPVPELPPRDIVQAVRQTVGERRVRSIGVVLAGDDVLARLHLQYMNDPSPTDVLTFDLGEAGTPDALEGEVVVSVETARREAKRRRLPQRTEILRYVIHGALHLLGYDDATPAGRRRMRRRENAVLAALKPAPRSKQHNRRH